MFSKSAVATAEPEKGSVFSFLPCFGR